MKFFLKSVLCCYFLTTFNIAHSQQNTAGKVVISEAELTSLVNVLKKHKFYRDSISSQKLELKTTITKQSEEKNTIPNEETQLLISSKKPEIASKNNEETQKVIISKNEDISHTTELIKLQDEIKDLKITLSDYITKQSTITNTTTKPQIIKEQKIIASAPIVKTEFKEKLITKYDTIYVENGAAILQSKKDSLAISFLNKKIHDLKLELALQDSLKSKDINLDKAISIAPKTEKNTFNLNFQPLFFENNSFELSSFQKQAMISFTNLIKNNTNIYVHLKGFASNVGNKHYNNILAKNRIESVKNLLIQNEISLNRILSENNGIDLNTKDDSKARRVEIEILEKK